MRELRFAVRVTRAPFFTAAVVPVLLGAAVAWQEGRFHLGLFLLTLLGALAVHAGLNTGNDYFDHLSGNDAINRELTPFSGGSRVLQEGIWTGRQMLALSLSCYGLAILIGLYLTLARGWPLLAIGLAGVFLAYAHNGPPFRLYYLAPGLGEAAVGIGFGPLMVLGTYFVQTQQLSLGALWASLPVGALIAAVLYINEFPDYAADKAAGRKTVAVVLGRRGAVNGYIALLATTYITIVIGVITRLLPLTALLGLLTAPIAWRAVRGARRFHSDTPKLIPTNAATIQMHLATGLLLSLAYLLSGALA